MSPVKMVEVWRGSLVESTHLGVAAVANAHGEIVEGWGDIDLVTYPRSALKPVQAMLRQFRIRIIRRQGRPLCPLRQTPGASKWWSK